jgi:hypothetical protein
MAMFRDSLGRKEEDFSDAWTLAEEEDVITIDNYYLEQGWHLFCLRATASRTSL